MGLKKIFFALVVLSMSIPGFAADVKTTEPPAADGKSSPPNTISYFTGVWEGKWPWGVDGVEITITVGKKQKNGMFGTSYSWGMGRLGHGNQIKSGSLKAWGKEQGDQFLFEWKNKEGVKSSITLIKGEKEDPVKAIFDTDGASSQSDSSARKTYLKRK